jgi:hypothetical protein
VCPEWSALIDVQQQRVQAAHQRIYGARRRLRGHWLEFLTVGLPRLVRREKRFVPAPALLFFVPLSITLWLLQGYPDGVFYFLSSGLPWIKSRVSASDQGSMFSLFHI